MRARLVHNDLLLRPCQFIRARPDPQASNAEKLCLIEVNTDLNRDDPTPPCGKAFQLWMARLNRPASNAITAA
ncbi:MAG: hypothetical protein R3E18_04740 [Sphingomonadaceae bacterium]